MNRTQLRLAVVAALVLSAVIYIYIKRSADTPPLSGPTHSFGGITFRVPDDFGLAISGDQIPKSSYIPPCDQNFDYCVYFLAGDYDGTNFDSAGLRIKERQDLRTANACINTLPRGYGALVPRLVQSDRYSASVFGPLGDAAAGHYSTGELYRLFHKERCHEFETRIAESQYGNYEPRAVSRFTDADRERLERRLDQVLRAVTFAKDGALVVFPPRVEE